MPYMPNNFYPKNCAIDVSRDTTKSFTWSADLDEYDSIDGAEIMIYSYYTKSPICSIILSNEGKQGVARIRFSKADFNRIDWWEPVYDNEGNIEFENDNPKKSYRTQKIAFKTPFFPMTKETGFKFELPFLIDFSKDADYDIYEKNVDPEGGSHDFEEIKEYFIKSKVEESDEKFRENLYKEVIAEMIKEELQLETAIKAENIQTIVYETKDGEIDTYVKSIILNDNTTYSFEISKSRKTDIPNFYYRSTIERLMLENFKYYWTLSVTSLNKYDTWVADGKILKTGMATTKNMQKQWLKIHPNEYIRPQGQDVFNFEDNKTYYEEQVLYNESTGNEYSFFVEKGCGYFNETGVAERVGYFKDAETSSTKDTEENFKRYAIFSSCISPFDNTGEIIFKTSKAEAEGTTSVYVYKVENGEVDMSSKKKSYIGYYGEPREKETMELTIDIYKFPVESIKTMGYYYPDKSTDTNGIAFVPDDKILTVDENYRPFYIYKDTLYYADEPDKFPEGSALDRIVGPVTIVKYTDKENQLPLWIEKADGYSGEDIFIVDTSDSVKKKRVLRNLSGQYLNLSRAMTTLRVEGARDKDDQGNLLPAKNYFNVNDFFQIKKNTITSFENYYETFSNKKVYIYEDNDDIYDSETSPEVDEYNNTILKLTGPSRSFCGKYCDVPLGTEVKDDEDVKELVDAPFEWSYWELYLVTGKKEVITENGVNTFVELGRELVHESDKNYTNKINFRYDNFKDTEKPDKISGLQTWYELILHIKDRKNAILTSYPYKIEVSLDLRINHLLRTQWDPQREGVFVDFRNLSSYEGATYDSNTLYSNLVMGGRDADYIYKIIEEQSKDEEAAYMCLQNRNLYFGQREGSIQEVSLFTNGLKNLLLFILQPTQDLYSGNLVQINGRMTGHSFENFELKLGIARNEYGVPYLQIFKNNEDAFKISITKKDGTSLKTVISNGKQDTEKITFNADALGFNLSQEESPSIIRKIENQQEDKFNYYYIDEKSETPYLAADAVEQNYKFCATDPFNAKEPILISCYFVQHTDNIYYLNIFYQQGCQMPFVVEIPIGEITTMVVDKVEFFNNIGYKKFMIAHQENIVYFDKEIKQEISQGSYAGMGYGDYNFSTFGYAPPLSDSKDEAKIVLETGFGIHSEGLKNPFYIERQDLVSLKYYSFSGVAIYKYCYDKVTNALIKTELIKDIYCPYSAFWDYSVSNKYRYEYKFIPISERVYKGTDGKAYWSDYKKYISTCVMSPDAAVEPDYYDTTIFAATSPYSLDKIYYTNPYENSNNIWRFNLDLKDDSITYTSEVSVTPGSKYAKVSKSKVNYMQGQVTSKLGMLRDECVYERDNMHSLINLKKFLTASNMKMLRLKNGLCIPVDTQIKTSNSISNLCEIPTDVSFDWYQIEDEEHFFFYEPLL